LNNKDKEFELTSLRTEFELDRQSFEFEKFELDTQISKTRNSLTFYATASQLTLSFAMSLILVTLVALNLNIVGETIYLILIGVPALFAFDFYIEIKAYLKLKQLRVLEAAEEKLVKQRKEEFEQKKKQFDEKYRTNRG
jgi:uncharacterized membrane protein